MKCFLKDGRRAIVLSSAEKKTLGNAFVVLEQMAYHKRSQPESGLATAVEVIEDVIEDAIKDEAAVDDTAEEVSP